MKNKLLKIGAGLVIILFLVSTTSATISPQSLSDMSNTARDRYITAKTEYQQTTNLYETAKQDWLTARDRYKQSNNIQDLTVALEKANLFLLEVKRKLINHLERVSAYVEGEQNLEDIEKTIIRKVISKHGGNISHAAKELGLSRTSLYRRLEKYGL